LRRELADEKSQTEMINKLLDEINVTKL